MITPAMLTLLLVVMFVATTFVLLSREPKAPELTLRDGRDLLEDGEPESALPVFGYLAKNATEEHVRQEAQLWLARALEAIGEPADAQNAYLNYLVRYSRQLSGERKAEVQHAIGRLALDGERRDAATPWRSFMETKIREVAAEVEGSAAALIEDSKTTRLQAERAKRDLATLDLGRKVGDFVLAEKLGEGGFGEVYRAIRPVAIKFARDETSVERLRRFADLQAKVDSPRIVKPLEIDLSAERPYVVMELVDGPNLRSLIRSGGLEPKDALAIAKEIALALSDAHAAGVSHLDLKPENVLLDPSGLIKLTDFELGEVQDDGLAQSMNFSKEGTAGTLAYMSPEQRAGKPADTRSDVFTFGVMLFELLTGTLPEPGDKPSQFVEELPVAVDRIFERCFARQERRYADASEILLDLKAAVLDLPAAPLQELFSRLATEHLEIALAEEPAKAESAPAPEIAQEPEPEPEVEREAPERPVRPPLEQLMAAPSEPKDSSTERSRLAEPPLNA